MKLIKSVILAGILAASSATAFADTITNLTVGPLPTSLNYGDTFASASSGTTFFDAYYFTIPAGTANSITTSIDLGSILGLSGLRARLYAGNSNDTTNSVTNIITNWSTAVNAGIPGVTLETVVLNPVTLAAGAYTLQIKGTVAGLAGGSYAGVLNITNPVAAVPETESYAMLIAGLAMMGFISRRRKI
jgi:hypothetical protein